MVCDGCGYEPRDGCGPWNGGPFLLERIGDPDFTVRRVATTGEAITITCEGKSTHNLRLPIMSASTASMYNAGTPHVCYPLGQLVKYMVDNKTRFGALTSATRTYQTLSFT
jgi:hypothetical protein